MTENVIRVVYYVIQENLAMLKTESLYNLLEKCGAPIGNQLHSRKTSASIARSIDHIFMEKLTRFIATEECEEFMTIADEMTDMSGLKTLITKFRFFEGWDLREMVVTIVESTGTSMEMKAKAVEALESEFAEHTHLNKEEFREMFRTKNKGSGSDRASKMLKYARLLQEDCCASIQYNCDNHITESAYEKLQEAESRIENCEKVIKSAYTMQSKSASRKLKLKKCAEKWQKKHITLQNILDIKFATYNYEAGIATLEDYEQILKLANELKDDSTVTAKLRKKLSKLVKRMKDGRNFRTLIAYVTILKEISEYQKWGQLEKASAFERKQEIEKLGRRIEILRDETRLKLLTEKYIEMVDLNTQKLKNCKIKMSYMKMTQKQIRKDIKKKVKDFGDEFLKAKREIHAAEDPDILEPLSDFFDMRNWNAASFDPELHEVDGHENGIKFKQEVKKMLKKLEEGKDFYADLEATKVKLQAHEFLL